MKYITIFTPTFNRKYTLTELYRSLVNQSNQNFIWLIIDDGSTDGTEDLVRSFVKDKLIEIEYYRQENQGKHAAHNNAIKLCKTELFMCVDSDDTLVENAIEIILEDHVIYSERDILGYYYRKGKDINNPHGDNLPDNVKYVNIRDLYDEYNFKGEMAIVLLTQKVKNYSFPIFPNEKFITEFVFYYQINNIAPMVIFDKIIYLFEYLDDGYTSNADKLNYSNPYGTAISFFTSGYHSKELSNKLKKVAQFNAWKLVFRLNTEKLGDIKFDLNANVLSIPLALYYYVKFYVNNRTIKSENKR